MVDALIHLPPVEKLGLSVSSECRRGCHKISGDSKILHSLYLYDCLNVHQNSEAFQYVIAMTQGTTLQFFVFTMAIIITYNYSHIIIHHSKENIYLQNASEKDLQS
ncbi:hypothetical protein BDA99DRAFT_541696 [Phascolomyces articulosus]|uniref:Uncharacterized protein n=1 Tax=Phascolomyces articulosus TaxID=60185 RepID=A0AAD5K1A3_9FUNG|nr:hypothetical protein BDA99DRAFT_541696 [Phascolomyces articulosus]